MKKKDGQHGQRQVEMREVGGRPQQADGQDSMLPVI